ncbi:hypothetical protein HaLaN_05359, partial [Haematococcus lacustris]
MAFTTPSWQLVEREVAKLSRER